MVRLLALPFLLSLAASPARATPVSTTGVLLMAHGGNAEWNRTVEDIAQTVRAKYPVAVAFGMADGEALQGAADKLEAAGARTLIAVPLFVSSNSSLYEHTAWLLGLRKQPSERFLKAMEAMAKAMPAHHGHAMGGIRRQVKSRLPIVLRPALDDSPRVAGILAERAAALSSDPSKEALVLVAHGPVDDDEDKLWLGAMGRLAGQISAKIPFKDVRAYTLRDDAPPPVRSAAVERLRAGVTELGRGGRVLVVPELLARGGIEDKVVEALKGLDYAWDGRALAPHPQLAAWVEEQAAAGGRSAKKAPLESRRKK